MRTAFLILIHTLVLVGCAQTTDVRVQKLPEPPVITVPKTKLDLISDESTDAEVVSAYYDAVVRLKGALLEAINALNVYRTR